MAIPPGLTVVEYTSIDDALATEALQTLSEIAKDVMTVVEVSDDDDDDAEDPVPPSSKDVLRSLEGIRLYLQCQHEEPGTLLNRVDQIEQFVQTSVLQKQTQTHITDYFKRK
jgi:hypothetical protein